MNSTIGIGLWSMQQMSFRHHKSIDDILKAVSEMGVDFVDIYEDYIPCHPHVKLHELHQLRKKAEGYHLPVKGCWFCTDIIAAVYAGSIETVSQNFKEYLAVTQSLGGEFISIPFLFNVPGITMETGKEILLEFFEKVLPAAEEYKVCIAHELPRVGTSRAALDIYHQLKSDYYTLCPDLEAWRVTTEDIPLQHAENPDTASYEPEPLSLFKECLPYSPYIHFKLLGFDEKGEDPHFPIPEIMRLINESDSNHHLCIEYEGWIPDICPKLDGDVGTQMCVDLIKRYQNEMR